MLQTNNSIAALLKKFFWSLGADLRPLTPKQKYIKVIFDKISNIPGDIVECGVGKAVSFRIFAALLQESKGPRKLWGLDSFQGFPEPTVADQGPRNPQKGEWQVMQAEDILRIFFLLGFKKSWMKTNLKIIKGFFEETLPVIKDEIHKIALLHLDCDLYGSYKVCLEHLFPKVADGGVVMFDEYGRVDKWPGAKKAVDEYFTGKNHEIHRDDILGKYYLIKKL